MLWIKGNTVGSCKPLTEEERSVIIGTILGDGHLEMLSSGTVRLSIEHSLAQRQYADFLYRKLKRLVQTPPRVRWTTDRRFGERRPSYKFSTRRHPELRQLRGVFYNASGRKCVPRTVEQLLTPQAMAVWFMDDGSFKNDSRGLLLNTMSFSHRENRTLQEAIRRNFDIPTTLHVLRRWKRIYISARHSYAFARVVGPFIPASMRYKLQYVLANPVTTEAYRRKRLT